MIKDYFNKNSITTVFAQTEPTESNNVKYRKQIKFFGVVWRKEGFYGSYEKYTKEDLHPQHIITDDNIVLIKPYVILSLTDKTHITKYFDTTKKLEAYMDNLSTDVPLQKL